MKYFSEMDIEHTLQEYEFTLKAEQKIMRFVTDTFVVEMPPQETFDFIYQNLTPVYFKDYLKRYIYRHTGMTQPFSSVSDEEWKRTILESFKQNNAPSSLHQTSERLSSAVSRWITGNQKVSRDTVFLLGFGLRMKPEDVSDFLTKVLFEDDFRLSDPVETIYYYCYYHSLPYSKAQKLTDSIDRLPVPDQPCPDSRFLENEMMLLSYIAGIKDRQYTVPAEIALERFRELYARGQKSIAGMYSSRDLVFRRILAVIRANQITPADFEQVLCNGIRPNENGNMPKAKDSLLYQHFQKYRPSRQQITAVLNGEIFPDRYDLITLLFLIYGIDKVNLPSRQRYEAFRSEADELLRQCGMHPLYAANPYEAFIVLCIVSESPLAVYGDVWEVSYNQGKEE